MKTFNFKQGTIEELLRNLSSLDAMAGAIESSKIQSQRWFRRKNLHIARLKLKDYFYVKPQDRGRYPFAIMLVETRFEDKSRETYFIPLAFVKGPVGERENLLKVRTKDGLYTVVDAVGQEPFLRYLNDAIDSRAIIKGTGGNLVFESERRADEPRCDSIETNSTNSLVRLSYQSVLKFIRKAEKGINVEYEMTDFLTRNGFSHCPALEGGVGYVEKDGSPYRIAIKFKELANEGDGWSLAVEEVGSFFDFIRRNGWDEAIALRRINPFIEKLGELAYRTVEMHSVLEKDKDHPRFRPERLTGEEIASWKDSFLKLVKRSIDDAHKYVLDHPESSEDIAKVSLSIDAINRAFERLSKAMKNPGYKTRIHCDYHLGQVLLAKDGFKIIDFEGEPLRSPEERAAKYSPLKDVAGMLRSFHYAAYASYFRHLERDPDTGYKRYADFWHTTVAAKFTRDYLDAARKFKLRSVPYSDPENVKKVIALFKLEKAVYELCYELNNRPMWVVIPVAGIRSCLGELELI